MNQSINQCNKLKQLILLFSLDGQRCAETIKSIFDNAKDPDKVIIGVIEQNDPADDFCLSAYCEFYGTLGSMGSHTSSSATSRCPASNVYVCS